MTLTFLEPYPDALLPIFPPSIIAMAKEEGLLIAGDWYIRSEPLLDDGPVDLPLRLTERGVLGNLGPDVDRQNEQHERDRGDQVFIGSLEHWTLRFRYGMTVEFTGKGEVNDAPGAITYFRGPDVPFIPRR